MVSGILGWGGVSTGQCLERAPTFLVAGASLWALLSEIAKGGDIGQLRNVCGTQGGGPCVACGDLCKQTNSQVRQPLVFRAGTRARKGECAAGVREEEREGRRAGWRGAVCTTK